MSKGIFYAGLVCILWAVLIITPIWLPDFSAADIVFARFLVFAMAALAILLFRIDTLRRLAFEDFRQSVLLGGLGQVLFYLLLVVSIQALGAFPASILIGALPVFSGVASVTRYRHTFFAKLVWVLLVATFGLVVSGCSHLECWMSGVCFLAASFGLYRIYSGFQREAAIQPSSLDSNDQLLISGLAVIPWLLLLLLLKGIDGHPFTLFHSYHEPGRWRLFWLLAILGGLFGTLTIKVMWRYVLNSSDSLQRYRYSAFLPACSAGFIFAALGRLPDIMEWAAMGCLFCALYLHYRIHLMAKALRA